MLVNMNIELSRQSGLSQTSTTITCGLRGELPVHVSEALQQLRQACGECFELLDHEPVEHSGSSSSPDVANELVDDRLQDHPPAKRRQLRYLRRLCKEIKGLGLERLDVLSAKLCGKTVGQFRGHDASRMIDLLKEVRAGRVDLEVVMKGGER